jgi:hypothetical protein
MSRKAIWDDAETAFAGELKATISAEGGDVPILELRFSGVGTTETSNGDRLRSVLGERIKQSRAATVSSAL